MNRKQRRAEEKKLGKIFKKKSREIEDKISRMPDSCDECGKKFNKNDKSILDSWRIAVYDSGEINLVCGDCTPKEVSEIFNNDPINKKK